MIVHPLQAVATRGVVLRPARPRGRAGTAGRTVPGAAGQALRRLAGLAREGGSVVGAGLDGLAAGLVVGYVAATMISGGEKHLGLPWVVEWLITGLGAAVVALGGAAAAVAARWLLLRLGFVADHALLRFAPPWRGSRRVRRVLSAPGAVLRSLPVAWLGALAAVLALANLGSAIGPLQLFTPAGAMGPYTVLAGGIAAFGNAARRVARGSATAIATERASGGSRRVRRGFAVALAGAAVTITGYGGAVLLAPGTAAPLVAPSAALDGLQGRTRLEDPGAPGPFAVRELSYGSGTDSRRAAFGAEVDLRTPTVDASRVLTRLGAGADEARDWFWGFGTDALPLNGLAWLPQGSGPFPLVLIVHGNHAMGDFSEPGYAYLGEHLASRGFITVSVDEDFLNGSWAGDWGGSEQLARAWLLLLHVDQWRSWSADPASPLHGLVDLDRVALVGHSRGGEAAAVAASLVDRATAPALGLEPWPVGLRIRAVIGIAPSDGQYARGPVVLKGIDFLTLHGGHDSDATAWMGIRQYARTLVSEGGFKAALWSYRSNHGQFNTAWGRSDHGDLGGAILNLAPIQDAAEQEDVARTAIGAFLEASLHRRVGYRDLFRRPMVGREWLPDDDVYLVRSVDDRFRRLTTPDTAAGVEGVTIETAGFEFAAPRSIPLRDLLPDQGARAVELRWMGAGGVATWSIAGTDRAGGERATGLHLSVANGLTEANPALDPLDLRVELTTSDGATVALPLSRWGALPPPLGVQLVKDELLAALSVMDVARGAPVERVLQTYEIPFADFAGVDARLDPTHVTAMRLLVDRTASGSLWLSEVGLTVPS